MVCICVDREETARIIIPVRIARAKTARIIIPVRIGRAKSQNSHESAPRTPDTHTHTRTPRGLRRPLWHPRTPLLKQRPQTVVGEKHDGSGMMEGHDGKGMVWST